VLGNGWPDAVKRWSWVWAHKNIGGSLGMGKSALLGYVTDQINQDFGTSFFHRAAPWLAVYVKVSEKTRSTAQVMASALTSIYKTQHGVSVERRLVGRLRHRIVALDTTRQFPPGLSSEPETKFADDAWLEDQGVQLEALNKGVGELLRREGVKAAVADAFATCTLKELVLTYLEDPESSTFRPAHVNEAFLLLLNEVAKVARAADLVHVTLILDDFYHLVRNTRPAEREALAAKWREVVVDGDYRATRGNLFNWVAVMHTKTAGGFSKAWEDASMQNVAPLFERTRGVGNRPGVHLDALPIGLGGRVLETYLKYSRSGRASSAIFPFTDQAISYILEFARQKGQERVGQCDPRNLLEVTHHVFVSALFEANEQSTIDLPFAQHVLEGVPLPVPTQNVSVDAVEAADESEVAPRERRMALTVACACTCHSEDGSAANDIVALIAGGIDDRAPEAILGYRCLACNAPVPTLVS
jgi:hypothetical protein